ncbi:MAG TPA: LysR family transcriptional regulator [Chloroflexia bacterium]
MLNLYQLQMFLAVVDSGSFSAAAEHLHVTQPAVSEGVRALEQRLNMRLFDRRGHRAALTPEGANLIATARHLLALADHAEQGLLGQKGVLSGALRLATGTSAGAPLLGERLGAFAGTHPAVRLTLVARAPAAVLDGLREGEFDTGFVGAPLPAPRLHYLPLAADEWLLLAPPGHAWAGPPAPKGAANEAPAAADPPPTEAAPVKRKRGRPPARRPDPVPPPLPTVALAALRDQPLVLESADAPLGAQARRELRDLLEERDVPWAGLRPVLELGSPLQVLRAVEAGAGVALLPAAELAGYPGPAQRVRPEGRPLTRLLFAVRDSRTPLSPVLAAWWDFLTAHSAGPDPAG